jgi:hypothetical protein
MPNLHLSEITSVKTYASNSNAILKIKSVPTDLEVHFPAFLTTFSQTFDATWNTEDVFGRMDPIATYQGTKRTMSLAFDIPSASVSEAKINLAKCAELVQMVYPVYNSIGPGKAKAQILSKAPLVRIQFANLISATVAAPKNAEGANTANTDNAKDKEKPIPPQKQAGLLGWMAGLNWNPVLEMGMFTQNDELYPKVISISFSFNILHEDILSQGSTNINNWPFGVKI